MKPLAALLAVAGVAMLVAAFAGGDAGPRGAVAASATGTDRGLRVFVAQGCGSCHTVASAGSHGSIGPPLELTLTGRSRAYVRESIVDPAAGAVAGWSPGAMPLDYADRLGAGELDALVGFLRRAAAGRD